MRIRSAAAQDLTGVVALTEMAYAPYTELLGAPPLPVTEDYAPRLAAGQVWLAEDEAGLAGLIVLERDHDHVLIFSVAVAPDRQGQGIGRRLLAFAEEQAQAWACRSVRLYTNARMERNIALYAACGYRETGRRPNPRRPGWTLVDMEKALA
ncbi:GNAT family N-acetyltransferase [Marinivivus vitaminiproducens]|uniref:GNAT family N-acetyltransferase n=1 Tax=Marinivivus vitaminiproducens TaxID=3035935 RepID=UPI0027990322|nr:GNAT family N-acetyltransferase [Geminicoccaceae bacterium SCSIO 64248]